MDHIIWEGKLDDTYDCRVTGPPDYASSHGILSIRLSGVLIYSQEVEITYDELLIPDVDDVRHWQSLCASAVNEWEKTHARP